MAATAPRAWRAVLRGAIGELGKKVAGKAGEIAADEIGELIGPALKELFGVGTQVITKSWKELYQKGVSSKSKRNMDV